MALVVKSSSWTCKFCGVSLYSAEHLCWHVVGNRHRTVLWQVAPQCLTEVGRLQCFLDTHLSGEPILGLEYVVEQQAGSAYLYTCLLCHAKEDWQGMFIHVIDVNHVARYIDWHHPWQAPMPRDFPNRIAYVQALTAVATEICETFGSKSIRHQEEVAGGDCKNGNAAREAHSGSEEGEEQYSLKRKMVMDSERSAKQPRSSNEVLEYLKKFTNRDHFCSLCSVFCSTTVELYEHVMGIVHEGNLACLTPEQIKESTRLHNFLDTYMKGEPILGLGFIAEKEVDTVYMYTCLLCGAQENWPHIFTHLVTVDHMARYMDRYHRVLGPKPKNFRSKEAYVKAVIASAIRVYKNLGDVSVPEAASEDDGEEENPSPLDSKLVQKERPCTVEKIPLDFPEAKLDETIPQDFPEANLDEIIPLDFPEAKSDAITQELQVLGVSNVHKHSCSLCQVSYPNAVKLCNHLMESKHRRMLGDAPPEVLRKLCCLKYYLGTLLKSEPFLGLEYVVENEGVTSCFYNCLLCSVNASSLQMLAHIGGAKHIMLYIRNHHSDEAMFAINVPRHTLKTYASQICELYGRKEILYDKDVCSPAESNVDDLPSKHDGKNNRAVPLRKVVREVIFGSTENSQTLKIEVEVAHKSHTGDICDSGWAAMPSIEDDDKINYDIPVGEMTPPLTSANKETELDDQVEFQTNNDFLDYLRSFRITDDADASIIQQISQNCFNALKRFSEEQAEAEGLQRRQQRRNELQMHAADT